MAAKDDGVLRTAARVADFLHGLYRLDPEAMTALVTHLVPCNRPLADHPTVQVHGEDGSYTVGLMGIVNGLLGARGQPLVVACVDDQSGELVGFDVYREQRG